MATATRPAPAADTLRALSPANRRSPHARNIHIVAPALKVADAAAASVFGAVRQRGPIARDTIARLSGLSVATVNRQVAALLEAGVLRRAALSGGVSGPELQGTLAVDPSALRAVVRGLEATGDPRMNLPWTYCATPTVTLPAALGPGGLPLGIQLSGRRGSDRTLLATAVAIEKLLQFHQRPPDPLAI